MSIRKETVESERRFRDTVQQAPVAITILRGKNYLVEMANGAYLELVDRSEATFVGRPLFESLPEVETVVAPLLSQVLESGIPFTASELEVTINRFGKKEQGFFNLVYQPLREANGEISGVIVVANEVTQQVKARRAIEESEIQFRKIVTQSPIAMTIFKGRDLIIDIANETLLKNLWRRKLEDVQGKKLLEVFPELAGQKFPALLEKVFDTGIAHQEAEAEAIIDGPGGKKSHHLDFEYSPLKDVDGTIFAIMVTVNDVSEKVLARQLISDAAERLILATEGTQMATWDLNLMTRTILHSPRLAEIFGFDAGKILSHPEMREYIHPKDRAEIVEPAFERALSNGIYFYESRVVHPNGNIRWIRTRGRVIFDDAKKPLRMVGTMIDFTEQKIAQQKIIENEERIKIVLEASELGIWELNVQTDVVTYSPRYLEIFGIEPNKTIEHEAFLKSLHPDFLAKRNKAYNEALITGVLFYESAVLWPDRSIHWIQVKGTLLRDEAGAPLKLLGTVRDITDEKSYNRKIEESEKRFRSVADTAPAMIWMATADKVFNFFNKAWLTFTGKTMGQEFGEGWMDGIHEDDRDKFTESYLGTFDSHKEFALEYRLRRHDGEYRWISNSGRPRFTSDGAFEGYIGACMDIHDRIIFEENLKESESRLRIAALSSELGTWTYHPATNHLSWDDQSKELFGVDKETIITVDLFFSRMHPDDRAPSLEKMQRALNPDIAETYDTEYRVIIPGAPEIRWIHAKGKAFFNEQREPYLFSGTILDITEKRKALEELVESERKFRTFADAMPQFIWTGDDKGVLNYFNESVYRYSGMTREEIKREGWLQIVHPDEQEENISRWIHSVATGEDFLFEHRFRKYDGNYRWQMSRAVPQRNADGKIQMWVGTSTDIHDKKMFMDELEVSVGQRTEELKISNEELRKSNSELEQFAYVASHDLQEPLRKIQTFVSRVMETENENLTAKGKDYLSRMQASSRRMQQLIMDLLSFSRATTAEKHFELIDLNLLLEKVKDQLSETIEKNHVTIKSGILPDLLVIPYQIEQLLTNLISNAIKFAKTNVPPVIRVDSGTAFGNEVPHTQSNPNQTYKWISITDNGIGFEPQFSDRIFQVFQRLHGKEAYEGTGIGLAICKKIAENHNGFINAESEKGNGATFTFYLPVKE